MSLFNKHVLFCFFRLVLAPGHSDSYLPQHIFPVSFPSDPRNQMNSSDPALIDLRLHQIKCPFPTQLCLTTIFFVSIVSLARLDKTIWPLTGSDNQILALVLVVGYVLMMAGVHCKRFNLSRSTNTFAQSA